MAPKPLLAITMGDPAGIGPEVTVKAMPGELARQRSRTFVVGDVRIIQGALDRWVEGWAARPISSPADAEPAEGTVDVLDLVNCDPSLVKVGEVDAYTGNTEHWVVKG